MIAVRQLDVLNNDQIEQLAEILVRVVADGASVGYLPPLPQEEAVAYWRGALKPEVRLLVAERAGRIVGTAQLELATRVNGRHRAEVNKVLVHPDARRQGIGRRLMEAIDDLARREGRTLLHLDTREGDPANALYRRMGYVEAGRIPGWARSANGAFEATVFYYKELAPGP